MSSENTHNATDAGAHKGTAQGFAGSGNQGPVHAANTRDARGNPATKPNTFSGNG